MSKPSVAMAGSVILLVGMLFLLNRHDSLRNQPTNSASAKRSANTESANTEIVLYCAASNRAVLEEIRAMYEKETGRSVAIQYGPSQTLLSQLEVSGSGDLYLPADDSFLSLAAEKGLVDEVIDIAEMQVGVAVAKGNPKAIHQLSDLFDSRVRVVQANPDAAAVAKLTRSILTQSGEWDALDQATLAYRSSVTDVTNDLLVGAADAGIVFDAVLHTYPDLEFVPLPEFAGTRSRVAVGVLKSSKQSVAALHFARYLSAVDRGLKHYAAHGFQTQPGDAWSDQP